MNTLNYDLEQAIFHPSQWIDMILYSNMTTDGKRIVNIHYSDKKAIGKPHFKQYNVWFIVNDDTLQDLINADSVGSEYWWNWSTYGGTPKTRYYGEALNFPMEEPEFEKAKAGDFFGMEYEHYERLRNSISEGNSVETIDEISKEIGRSPDDILEFINRMSTAKEMLEKANALAIELASGNMTKMQLMSVVKRDIEGMLGVHFNKEFAFDLINKTGFGKLNPKTYQKMVYDIKGMYDLLEKNGLKGASKIGRRWASAHNPLIKDRRAYLAKEVVKGELKRKTKRFKGTQAYIGGKQRRVYEGREAVLQVERYMQQINKAAAGEFYTVNKKRLVSTTIGKGKSAKKVYYWKKDVKFSRRLIVQSKKILKIARYFVV